MTPTQALVSRLTEVEKIQIRRANTEDAIIGLYHRFKPELPGGHLLGGTEQEGVEIMMRVHAHLSQAFLIESEPATFGRTWLF